VNYLSPSIRAGPWTEGEDRLLLELINARGFAWSAIGVAFNGRSDNDIKNRWYSHLKYQTIHEGGRLVLAPGGESPYPGRKKRNRAAVYPKQNALQFIQRQCRAMPRLIAPPPIPVPAVQPPEDPPPCAICSQNVCNFMMLDEGAIDQFSELAFFD
jgi:hypothetical protein